MSSQRPRHLRLLERVSFKRSEQLSLSLTDAPFVLYMADVTNVSEHAFLTMFKCIQPEIVIDLRVVPRFDFGRLNRRIVFSLLEEEAIQYVDLLHSLGVDSFRDVSRNPALLAGSIKQALDRAPSFTRALALMDDPQALTASLEVLPQSLVSAERRWKVTSLRQDAHGIAGGKPAN